MLIFKDENLTLASDLFNDGKYQDSFDLLNTIEIHPKFNFAADILKQRTKKPLNDAAYQKIIEDSIKLLLNIKEHTEQEQQGI